MAIMLWYLISDVGSVAIWVYFYWTSSYILNKWLIEFRGRLALKLSNPSTPQRRVFHTSRSYVRAVDAVFTDEPTTGCKSDLCTAKLV